MIRVATLLGPNTVTGLERIVGHLRSRDVEATVVPAAAPEPGRERIDADLVWACGLLTVELVTAGADLDVVAAPVFPGGVAPVYHSVIVARADAATVGRRLAVNEHGSWSGYRALFHDAAARADDRWRPDRMDEIVVTGAHVDSVAAVAEARADVAAIDHSIWDWLVANDPDAVAGLVVIDRTTDCPAPPFSVAGSVASDMRSRLTDALLGFDGPPTLVPASVDDYRFMSG